jgi:ribosome-binding factor A
MTLRREKLQELFKEEASAILQRRLRDPRIGFVSVTDVELSADLRRAKIFISVLGDEEAKRLTMEGLERAAGFVRSELARRITLRHTPEILFRLDDSIERGTRITALLREAARQDSPHTGNSPEAETVAPSDETPTRRDRGRASDKR